VSVEIDAEATKGFRHRVARPVGNGRDLPAAKILDYEALQEIVDLIRLEAQVQARPVGHRAVMLEVADAAGVEHDVG